MTTEGRIEDEVVDQYQITLAEDSRPPSRGGNTTAMHSHGLRIGNEWYGFLARGGRKWVFKGDTVPFDWMMSERGYKNIARESLTTRNKLGELVVRGNRDPVKSIWRRPTP